MMVGVTAIHGRDELTNLVLQYYKRIGIPVVAAVSREDVGKHTDLLAREIPALNEPLGAKWNAALKGARELEPDQVLIFGSDDLICEDFIAYAQKQEADLQYCRQLYVFNGMFGSLVYYPRIFCGAGRVLGRRMLDHHQWTLWTASQPKGLDGDSLNRITATPQYVGLQVPFLRENGFVVLDVKSGNNLHSFEKLTQKFEHDIVRDLTFLEEKFPEVFTPKMGVGLRMDL